MVENISNSDDSNKGPVGQAWFQTMESQTNQQIQLTRATNQLNLSITQTARQMTNRLTAFLNPLTRIEDSIRRSDATNREALKLGTTYNKLRDSISKNTDVVTRGNVNQVKLMNAFVSFTDQGVRDFRGAVGDLTEEMIATGQSTVGLGKALSDLNFLTGGNSEALRRVTRTNIEVSDKYGVSNERLINSLNSLRESFESISYFGATATASTEQLAQELTGRAGGADITRMLNTLFRVITPDMATDPLARQLGAGRARELIAANRPVTLQDIEPIFRRITQLYDESSRQPGGLRRGLTAARFPGLLDEQAVTQLTNLANIAQKDYSLKAADKKTNEETFASLSNLEQRSLNFYDNHVPKIIIPLLAAIAGSTAGAAGSQALMAGGAMAGLLPLRNESGNRRSIPTAIKGHASRAGRLMKGKVGGGLAGIAGGMAVDAFAPEGAVKDYASNILSYGGAGAMVAGVPGALIGGAAGALLTAIEGNTGKSAQELERQRMEEERKNREQEAIASKQVANLSYFAEYLRRNVKETRTTDPALRELVNELLTETKKLRLKADQTSNTGPLPLGN